MITKEVFETTYVPTLVEALWPDNAFWRNFVDGTSDTVTANGSLGATAVVPQEIINVGLEVNPLNWPLQVKGSEDAKKSYSLDYVTTLPTFIPNVQIDRLPYGKLQSVLRQHQLTLETYTMDRYIFDMTPNRLGGEPYSAAFVVRTSGADTRASSAFGSTAIVKKIAYSDILDVMSILGDQDMDNDPIYVISDSRMYYDLFEIEQMQAFISTGRVSPVYNASNLNGALGVEEFKSRSTFPVVDGATADVIAHPIRRALDLSRIAPNIAPADRLSYMLFIRASAFRYNYRFVGGFFEDARPTMQGPTANFAIYVGGMLNRIDRKGVVMLVESKA